MPTAVACSAHGCARSVRARGMCRVHYYRWLEENPDQKIRYLPRSGACSVEGCDAEVHSGGMCRRHREATLDGRPVRRACVYCGADLTGHVRARRYCSDAHAAMHRRHEGNRPTSLTCTRCGEAFDITDINNTINF